MTQKFADQTPSLAHPARRLRTRPPTRQNDQQLQQSRNAVTVDVGVATRAGPREALEQVERFNYLVSERRLVIPRKVYKCSKCDRSFKMAAHLARHASSAHGARKKKTAKKAKRRPMTRMSKRVGRPKGAASRFGLKTMSLERLTELIDAARHEARSKLAEIESSIG